MLEYKALSPRPCVSRALSVCTEAVALRQDDSGSLTTQPHAPPSAAARPWAWPRRLRSGVPGPLPLPAAVSRLMSQREARSEILSTLSDGLASAAVPPQTRACWAPTQSEDQPPANARLAVPVLGQDAVGPLSLLLSPR